MAEEGTRAYLLTEFGNAFTANGFGNKFKDWCRQADLPHCTAHGIRKATATALAENAATPHEIMSITGHTSLKEVERYTKRARMRTMADAAMAKLTPARQNLSHRRNEGDNLSKKRNDIRGRNGVWRSLAESNRSLHRERVAS